MPGNHNLVTWSRLKVGGEGFHEKVWTELSKIRRIGSSLPWWKEASDRGGLNRENKCAIAVWCVGTCVLLIKFKLSYMAGKWG